MKKLFGIFSRIISIHSIRSKIAVTFFAVILFSILLISGVLYSKFAHVITESSSSVLMKSINNTVYHLNTIFSGVESVTISFIGNKVLTRYLEDDESTVFETRDILEYIKKAASVSTYIHNIELYSCKKDLLANSQDEVIYKTFPMEIFNWYNMGMGAKGAAVWNEPYLSDQHLINNKSQENLISVSRQIQRNYFGELLGIVNITIKESLVKETLKDIKSYPSQEVYMINKDGIVLSHSCPEQEFNMVELKSLLKDNASYFSTNSSGLFTTIINGTKSMVLYATIEKNGWRLVSIVDRREILSDFNTIKKHIMTASFIALIIGAIFVIIISGSVYKPISILKAAMQKTMEGVFDVSITDKRKDEFGQLYESFNSMIETIDSLINELYEKKLLAAKAELKILQANINPHFIYNIFESMIWMIELERLGDLKNMVVSLSRFYRLVLSTGKDIITIKEVAEQIGNYVNLQKIVYKNMLRVDIDIDTNLYKYEMLNLLLQPIVENAIIHGVEAKSGLGYIKIKGELKEDGLMVFTIEDDGVGIHKDKLDEIKQNLSDSSNTKDAYYALKNINQRIKLHYGNKFGIDIRSLYGQGTKVTLLIPAKNSLAENTTQEVV